MEIERTNDPAISLLQRKFKEAQLKNPRWSMRAFSVKLGVSSGALSEIMNGKRNLSLTLKKKIADVLCLSPTEQLDFFQDQIPDQLRPKRLEYFKLSTDQFHLISDWWHYGILNLIRTKGFKEDPSWIGKRLGLGPKIIEEAIERLLRLGHLKRVKGRLQRAQARIETSDNLFDLSIRKSHLEDLKLIEKSLLHHGVDQRDHTSMTVVVDKKNIKKANELVRVFQDQFSDLVETKADQLGDEVYRLSVSFYPLSNPIFKPKENL